MTLSPRLIRAGLVTVNADTGAIGNVMSFQYNPDTLSRTLAPRAAGADGGERTEALRLAGPAVETIKLEAEFDGAPALAGEDGAHPIDPALAALEALVSPSVARLRSTASLAEAGTIEITPSEAPLTLFVWGSSRIMPVRITEFSIAEDAFTPDLQPIRAKVSLGLRVLSVADLPWGHRGSDLFLAYRSARERSAASLAPARLNALGVTSLW